MGSPYQWPWVKFFSEPEPSIDSTPTIICSGIQTTIVDSIVACNRSDQDIFVDLFTLMERERNESLTPITNYRQNKFLIPKNGSAELLTPTHTDQRVDSLLILQSGDLLYANSDYSGNLFDCLVVGRRLLEDP